MTRTGRNDPCPCGSGKKYKNCCMKSERAERIRQTAWRADEQVTLDKLLAFAQRPAFNAQLPVAFNLFWNGNYGAPGLEALDREDINRFVEWYTYDYRVERSMKRVIDLFLEQMDSSLLPGERERVRTWQSSYLGLYRIREPGEAESLSVVDVLQGMDATVLDPGLSRLGLPGDLVLGRLLRTSMPPHFSWAAILLAASMESGLVSFIRAAYEQYVATHSQAPWQQFLSDSGYLFNHYLLRQAAEAGKQVVLPPYYSASIAAQKLLEVEKQQREQAARQAEKRQQEGEKRRDNQGEVVRQTKGGVLLPGYVQYKGSKEVKP